MGLFRKKRPDWEHSNLNNYLNIFFCIKCVYGLVIHAATPTAGRGSSKLSFTIRDSVEDTINVEIKLDNNQTALDYYQNFNFMDTIVKVTNPDFIQNEESDLLHRPFTLGWFIF